MGSGEGVPNAEREATPLGTDAPLSTAEELEEGDALVAREGRPEAEGEAVGGCEGDADTETRGEEVAEGETLLGCEGAPPAVPNWAADAVGVAAAGAVGATLPLPSPGDADCATEGVQLREPWGDAVS